MFLKGFREFINESTNGATYADLKLLLELGITDDIQDDMYRGFNQGTITHDELLDWITPICDKYEILNWSINEEGIVDVDGDVDLAYSELTQLPLRFGRVSGTFYCNNNQLTTLTGAPRLVGENFWCHDNHLTTLDGAPKEVGGSFLCGGNYLITLEGGPEKVGKDYRCNSNQLTTLKGAPREVGWSFHCSNNQLTSLDGIGEVGGKIYSDIK